jgi:hypothetical protein
VLGEGERLVDGRVAADQHELFASVAREHVLGPERGCEAPCHLLEDVIAGQVAVGVVDLLEVIDVDEDERQRRLSLRRVVELGRQTVLEVFAVERAREPVANGRIVEASEGGLFLGGDEREAKDRPNPSWMRSPSESLWALSIL